MLKNRYAQVVPFALLAAAGAVQASDDSKYPAAHFEPKVIYTDAQLVGVSHAGESRKADPKFPAAYFEPKVIYQDKDASHH
jgi:hypothetical protein